VTSIEAASTPADPPADICGCDAQHKIKHLEVALASSRRIGAAVGILMATYKVPERQAFDMLVAVSQHHQRKLRDLADDVVATGSLDWAISQSA
jgi:AmiR/NasT family two-component response regulator